MKRFIRHRKTREFLMRDGQWTLDWRAAMVFLDVKSTYEEFKLRNLKEVESVVIIDDDPTEVYDIAVPLPYLDPTTGQPWL